MNGLGILGRVNASSKHYVVNDEKPILSIKAFVSPKR